MLVAAVSDVVLVALIVAIGPMLLAYFQSRAHRRDRAHDEKRQDAQAKAAAASAKEIVKSNEEAAAIVSVVAHTVESVKAVTDVTHALVNSDKTSGMQKELATMKRERVLLAVIIDMNKHSGIEPAKEALDAIAQLDAEILAQQTAITDRLAQQAKAEASTVLPIVLPIEA